jgi:hypothetical protein
VAKIFNPALFTKPSLLRTSQLTRGDNIHIDERAVSVGQLNATGTPALFFPQNAFNSIFATWRNYGKKPQMLISW